MEFLGLQTSHGPWTLFWGVQVLGPMALVRAGAWSPGAHPQHHIFRCSPIATQWVERASSFPEWGYRVTYPDFPCFCQSCDSAPFLPLWQVFCLIHVCHFHFTLTWEKGRKCLHWQNIAAEFWVSVCAQSGRDGKQPYHRLPCGHREVVHSYLGWLLNNLVSAITKNSFPHSTLCMFGWCLQQVYDVSYRCCWGNSQDGKERGQEKVFLQDMIRWNPSNEHQKIRQKCS